MSSDSSEYKIYSSSDQVDLQDKIDEKHARGIDHTNTDNEDTEFSMNNQRGTI